MSQTRTFRLWVFGDCHVGTDLRYGRESLADALRTSEQGGDEGGPSIEWEIAIDVYDDRYTDNSKNNVPVELHAGKQMGLMLAYCDNDGSELRENFIGSESVPTGPKDRGWIDAGLFGTLELSDGE